MKVTHIISVLIGLLGASACAPATSIPGVLEPLDSPKWKTCADELAKRESGAMFDDLTLDGSTKLCQGAVAAADGKTEKALGLFNEAGVADKTDHRPHYLAGRVLAEAGRYEEALTEFERSHKLYPSMEVPSERMGRTIAKKSTKAQATLFLRRAKQRDLCPYGCQGLLAMYLHELDQDTEAEEIYNEMVAADPSEPAGWVGLASIHNAKSDFTTEVDYLEKAIASPHFKDLSELQKADIYYALGFAKFNLKIYSGARTNLDEAIKRNGKRADWYLLSGWIALAENDASKALSAFDTARDLDPHSAAVHCGIGDAMLILGDIPAARKELSLAWELDPTNGVYAIKTAIAAATDRDFEIAEKLFEDAKNVSPSGLPKELMRKIEELLSKKNKGTSK